MTTLDELRERLKKAEGPDRELDARIWNALFNEGREGALGRATEGMVWVCEIHFEQYGGFKVAPDYTASLDTVHELQIALLGKRGFVLNDMQRPAWEICRDWLIDILSALENSEQSQ